MGLLLPFFLVVQLSGWLSGGLEPLFQRALSLLPLEALPPLLWEVLGGPYGLLSMVPLLTLWALPLVFLYGFLLAAYQYSGLLAAIAFHLDPRLRPLGLSGRDLAQLVSGLGCKVPLASRGRQACSPAGLHLLAFAVPCSFQMAAILSVLVSQGMGWLLLLYLGYLGLVGGGYAWWFWGRRGIHFPRAPSPGPVFAPDWRSVLLEAYAFMTGFTRSALPLVLGAAFLASFLRGVGGLAFLEDALGPLWSFLGLPPEAGLALGASWLRKDGILLLAPIPLGPGALLLALYLAGSLGPCLVTLLALGRAEGGVFLRGLLLRQVSFAAVGAMPLVLLSHIWR